MKFVQEKIKPKSRLIQENIQFSPSPLKLSNAKISSSVKVQANICMILKRFDRNNKVILLFLLYHKKLGVQSRKVGAQSHLLLQRRNAYGINVALAEPSRSGGTYLPSF